MQSATLRTALLRWYDRNRRDLPWRRSADPYAIWLSEIMLQQTTVRAVEPRWNRFLQRFPNINTLANAPLDEVLNEWSGLGYYARARNLHAAARRIAEDFNGRIPKEFEVLLALPGMGRYTAAAVASIAFNQKVAVVDANVERVIARLDAIADELTQPRTKRQIWQRAQEILAPRRPGDWNQAMMELGAIVCLPRAPQCPVCPIAQHCKARILETPESFPVKKAKPLLMESREVALLLRKSDHVLVLQRPGTGSFAGMWELPRGEARHDEQSRNAACRVAQEIAGLEIQPLALILRIKHVVMRRRIKLSLWSASARSTRIKLTAHAHHAWLTPEEWLARPISTTQKQIAEHLAGRTTPERAHAVAEEELDLFGVTTERNNQ